MEQTVTLGKIQKAMKDLRDNGERISRRNVRRITGGSMSTVHRLMSQIEDVEALQASNVEKEISQYLQKAISSEIEMQVGKITRALQQQVCCLQDREQQALDELAKAEKVSERLQVEVSDLRKENARDREKADRENAKVLAVIALLEKALDDQQGENQKLIASLGEARIEETKARTQTDYFKQIAEKEEKRADKLIVELTLVQERSAESDKRNAVYKQQVTDLRSRISKMKQSSEPQ